MEIDEIHLRVNAIHRLKTVIHSLTNDRITKELIPYLHSLVKTEDDEVLFAIAEDIGKVFQYVQDKTAFLPILKELAGVMETVVRQKATESMDIICPNLTDAEL